jgi:hypothetical protein
VLRLFESLEKGELPEGYKEPKYWVGFEQQPNGRILTWFGSKSDVPNLSSLPSDVQAFINLTDRALVDASTRSVNLLRWRFGIRGPHEPLHRRRFLWSADAETWRFVPCDSNLRIWMPSEADFSHSSAQEIQSLIAAGSSEPLGHSLWREAWEQRESNPRRALVIGMAAAEVGFKQFVADVVPKAAWLIEELQSPPLEKLMRAYLPMLLKDKTDLPVRQLPAGQVINPIKDAGSARNTVVHKSPTAMEGHQKTARWLKPEGLESALLAVSDLLWFLDYYRGHSWALDHVRKDTLAAWKALANKSTTDAKR